MKPTTIVLTRAELDHLIFVVWALPMPRLAYDYTIYYGA
jgi:hypothetical protein